MRWRRLLPLLATAGVAAAGAAALPTAPARAAVRTPGAATTAFSYLAHPTDQLAIPGEVANTEVTPEGDLYTGWVELGHRFGPDLRPWDVRVRTLEDDRWPVLTSTATASDGVRYDLSLLADHVGGAAADLVHVTLTNTAGTPQTARWASSVRWSGGTPAPAAAGTAGAQGAAEARTFRFPRPVAFQGAGLQWQPGAAFDPLWTYAFDPDGALLRDGQLLLLPATAATAPPGASTTQELRPQGPGPVAQGTELGQTTTSVPLAPGQTATLDERLPVQPVDPTAPSAVALGTADWQEHRQAVLDYWQQTLAPALHFDVPEAKVADAYVAALETILQSRYEYDGQWVQAVNALRYHAFWLRDGAMMANALDLAGLHDQAQQDLGFFAHWQRPDGLFISRPGQYDGVGEAIWALAEHVRRTHDREFAAQVVPEIDRATAWIVRSATTDPDGLIPSGDPKDDELVRGHLLGDDFWAVAGLDAAVRMATVLGDPRRAAAYKTQRDVFRDALRRSVVKAAKQRGGAIPAALETSAGRDWGNLWAAWPGRVLSAFSPQVTATLDRVRAQFKEGIATYGPQRVLHGYIAFRVFETELIRGEQSRVVNGLYAELAHTTATHGWFELGIRPRSKREVSDNLAPHGWAAAEYVELLRNMLIREEGGQLELFGAVSPDWIAPGQHVALDAAPTAFGPVTARLEGTPHGAVLTWDATVPAGTPLSVRLPYGVTGIAADGHLLSPARRTLALPARSGRIDLTFTRGPAAQDPSFAKTVRALGL